MGKMEQTRQGNPWLYVDMGLVDYKVAWDFQQSLVEGRARGTLASNVVLFLEHFPVFTLGRKGGKENLKVEEAFLEQRGIPVVQVERGGNITYHGPGQLIGYLIVKLLEGNRGVTDIVEGLEEVMIRSLADWDIRAGRNPLNRGVWYGMNKIGSIGLAVRRGITFHGFSLNVNLSMEPFSWIHPCGLTGVGMSSMEQILGREISMADIRQCAARHTGSVFNVDLEMTTPQDLRPYIEERRIGEKFSKSNGSG
jgi:lipoate-protein ligase B